MYKIGEFSKITGISIRALRYYDKINLLKPDDVDIYTGYRYYTRNKIKDVKIIKTLQELEFSLEEIKESWGNFNEKVFITKQKEIKKSIIKKNKKLLKLKKLSNLLEDGKIVLEKEVKNITIKKYSYDELILMNDYTESYESSLLKQGIFDYYIIYNDSDKFMDLYIDKAKEEVYKLDNIKYLIDYEEEFNTIINYLKTIYKSINVFINVLEKERIEKLILYGFTEVEVIKKLEGKFIKFRK